MATIRGDLKSIYSSPIVRATFNGLVKGVALGGTILMITDPSKLIPLSMGSNEAELLHTVMIAGAALGLISGLATRYDLKKYADPIFNSSACKITTSTVSSAKDMLMLGSLFSYFIRGETPEPQSVMDLLSCKSTLVGAAWGLMSGIGSCCK